MTPLRQRMIREMQLQQFTPRTIDNVPLGENAPLNQVLLRAAGVVQDSFGQIHVRGDMGNVQYRLIRTASADHVARCAGGIRWMCANEVVFRSWFTSNSRKSAIARSFSLSETAGC